MEKKYIMTNETSDFVCGKVLYRIQAIRDFNDVKKGDLGGWIEKESNLSHDGDSWIYENAIVYGDAVVSECAAVGENATVCGTSMIFGVARVFGNAYV